MQYPHWHYYLMHGFPVEWTFWRWWNKLRDAGIWRPGACRRVDVPFTPQGDP